MTRYCVGGHQRYIQNIVLTLRMAHKSVRETQWDSLTQREQEREGERGSSAIDE